MTLKQRGINLDISHLRALFFFTLARIPMHRTWRKVFIRLGGVRLRGSRFFIARDVRFDTMFAQNITIENDVHIASGVQILTHRLDTSNPDLEDIHFIEGHITIKEHAFIGCSAILTGDITIGRSAIIGAGSVVTKSVPDNEVWAGNPARFIKKRG